MKMRVTGTPEDIKALVGVVNGELNLDDEASQDDYIRACRAIMNREADE